MDLKASAITFFLLPLLALIFLYVRLLITIAIIVIVIVIVIVTVIIKYHILFHPLPIAILIKAAELFL